MVQSRAARRVFLLLAYIFLIAIWLRIAAVYLVSAPDLTGYTESGITARNWVEGRGYTFDFYGTRKQYPLQSFMPPLFTILIAFCLRFFDNPGRALSLIQATLSSLTSILVYFIAYKVTSRQAIGLLAAMSVAIYPVFILTSVYPISLTLNTFLLAVLVLATTALQEQPTPLRAFIVGLALGLMLLTKPTLFGFLPIIFIVLWIVMSEKKRLLGVGAIIVVTTFAIILPWSLRNMLVQNQFVLFSTNGGWTFWIGNNPFTTGSGMEVYTERVERFSNLPHDSRNPAVLDMLVPYPMPREIQTRLTTIGEIELDRSLYQAGLDFMRANPGRWLELAYTKFLGFWWLRTNVGGNYPESWTGYYALGYVGVLVFFLGGIILSLHKWRGYLVFYFLFALYTLVSIMFHVQTRYRWEIEPFILIFVALALVHGFDWFKRRFRPRGTLTP